jgi:O-acetylserine/cysteine efflux transporter
MNFVMAKLGLMEFSPVLFSAIRFAMIAVVLAPFLKWAHGQMRVVLIIALTAGAFHFALMFTGISLTDASVAAVVTQLNVPFATFLSIVVLGEVVGWQRWLGLALAFGGVTFISFDPQVFSYIVGVLFVAAGAFSMAIAMIFMRRIENVGAMQMQAWLAAISAPILIIMSLVMESGQIETIASAPLWAWGTIVYSVVAASIFGHAGMYYLIQRYEVSLVGPMTLLAPVLGIVFSVSLLGEGLTFRIVAGAVVTLAGVAIVAARQRSAAGEEIEPV